MLCDKWDEEDWDTLIDPIQTGNCILMLGPDVAAELFDGAYKPLTEILANNLADIGQINEMAESEKIPIDTSNLAQMSLYYEIKTRRRARPKVEEFYRSKQGLTSPIHENLATLPFHLIITSTPDNMFYNAVKKIPTKNPLKAHYNFSGKKQELVIDGKTGSETEPLIFYLYGVIEDHNSLVLTENDFLNFLVKIASGNPPIPMNILSELRNKENSFLFLGFGFRHWYLRILLHILQIESKKYSSFALEQFYFEKLKRDTVYFFIESDYRIRICNANLISFSSELKKRYDNKILFSPKEKLQVRDAPSIFICHAEEDKSFAIKLYKELEEKGFKPWLDKEDLNGGVSWNEKIIRTLNKIDYVIIIASESLRKKNIGYVNKEITLALDRQTQFRNLTFIIPVLIDNSPVLEELNHLQVIDFKISDGIEKLCNTIKRDQQLRKR